MQANVTTLNLQIFAQVAFTANTDDVTIGNMLFIVN